MIKVGITGGIGSGKTAFCRKWEELGACVIYADDVAKELMNKDEALIIAIKKTFGEDAYTPTGELNRSYLANEAFSKNRVEELNKLVHPVLWDKIDEMAKEEEKRGTPIFAYEAAILLKNGRPENLDYVILVMAEEKTRIKRVSERDNISSEQIIDRIAKQQDFESLTHLSDYLVMNDGSLKMLREKAREIYKFLSETT